MAHLIHPALADVTRVEHHISTPVLSAVGGNSLVISIRFFRRLQQAIRFVVGVRFKIHLSHESVRWPET